MPFEWTLNPYRGCAFACRYCYARYTHEFLDLDPGEGFDRHILMKRDFVEVLERDLQRLRHRGQVGERIAIGTATDPYQPVEHRFGLTRGALELFARECGHRLSITTKSDIVVRDLDVLREIQEQNHVRVHVSITTLDRDLARKLEPGAPSPAARLSTIATLARAGIEVDAFVMPILPGITDSEENLDTLFEALATAGVSTAVCDTLFLRSPTKEHFFSFLAEEMPAREEFMRRRYEDSVFASPLYVERLQSRVRRLRERWGLLGASKVAELRSQQSLSYSGELRSPVRNQEVVRRRGTDQRRRETSAGRAGSAQSAGRSIPDRRTPSMPKGTPPRSQPQQLWLF